MPRRIISFFSCIGMLSICLFFCLQRTDAQVKVTVTGLVADIETRVGLPGVTIINKVTRMGTITDESGRFTIDADLGDTLQLTMLTYNMKELPVPAVSMFINVYMTKKIFDLGQVTVQGRNYLRDSLATRDEYGRYFNYHKPGAKDILRTLPAHPITAITYLVPSKARKRQEHFKEQLVYWEKEKYVDNRYNEDLVAKMTRLSGDDLDSFMHRFRPGYQFLQEATDYDLMLYIKQSFQQYQIEKAQEAKQTQPAKKEEQP